MNVGTNASATSVTNDGGPTDYYHGANFSGFPSGMWMAVRHFDVEQNRGPAFDVVQSYLVLDQVTNSDVSAVQAGTPATAVNMRADAFSNVFASTSGLFIYGGRMFGSPNALATISFQNGMHLNQFVMIGAQIESSGGSGVSIALNNAQIGAIALLGNNSLSLNPSVTTGKVTGIYSGSALAFVGNASGNTVPAADIVNALMGRLRITEPYASNSTKTINVTGNVLQILANDGSTVLGTVDDSGNLAGLTSIAVGGDPKFSSSPREPYNAFLSGALTSTWTGESFTLDKAITVTRVQAQAKTAPAGCTTNAVVRVTDGTSPVNLTIAAAANDSGTLTQNFAAGAVITISVNTAAAGCTTSPADVNVVVQYRMQ